jgi:hypothetical protein
MNETPPGRPVVITFIADHRGGLPVAFGAAPVPIPHEPLDREARELGQAMEVSRVAGQW